MGFVCLPASPYFLTPVYAVISIDIIGLQSFVSGSAFRETYGRHSIGIVYPDCLLTVSLPTQRLVLKDRDCVFHSSLHLQLGDSASINKHRTK